MNITVDLPNEIYQLLEKRALLHGLTIPETVARLIEETEPTVHGGVFEQMRAEGILLPKSQAPAQHISFEPIEVSGRPTSEILLEERR